MYGVEVEFDGHRLHAAGSGKGETVRVAALDSNWDRQFELGRDEVIFRKPEDGRPITRQDLEAFNNKEALKGLDQGRLESSGLALARANEKGEVVLNPGAPARIWAQMRGAKPGSWLSLADKTKAAAGAHRSYRVEVDQRGDALDQKYIFDPKSYQGYVDDMRTMKMRNGLIAAAGLGTFALAYSQQAAGTFALIGIGGLLVGAAAGLTLMMSTFYPWVFNPGTEAQQDWTYMHPEGFRIADFEQANNQSALKLEADTGQQRLSEYFQGRREAEDLLHRYLEPKAELVAQKDGYVVIGGVRVKRQSLTEYTPR